jgi:4-hydroxy-tetrahydrodipicolinate reductase
MTTTIAIIGATGRMGVLAAELIAADSDLELVASLDSKSNLDQCLGADIVLDLTNPQASEEIVDFAIRNNKNILVGTSGWSKEKIDSLRANMGDSKSKIFIVPNFSLGSVLATKFASDIARHFDSVEIIETHHTGKFDSPSGTALFTAASIAQALEKPKRIVGSEQPARGQLIEGIPVHSLRIEGAHAEQDIILASASERLVVSHTVSSNLVYAKGMLIALKRFDGLVGLNVGLGAVLDFEGI